MPWNRPFHVINYFKLLNQRNNQKRNNVDNLDHRVDRRSCSVLVRIADCVACYRGFVSIAALLMNLTLWNQ